MYAIPSLLFIFLLLIPLWMIFKKAGRPGWAAIIPIYNVIVLLQVVREPLWRIILFFIPVVNVIYLVVVWVMLAQAFGRSILFAAGLLFLPIVFLPILAFGPDRYTAPSAMPVSGYSLDDRLWRAIKEGRHLEDVKSLIRRGASPDARGENGMTPMMYAARNGRLKLMVLLMVCHADVNAGDDHGKTPLMYAVESDNLEMVDFLLDDEFRRRKGREIFNRNPELYSPL